MGTHIAFTIQEQPSSKNYRTDTINSKYQQEIQVALPRVTVVSTKN